MERAFSLSVSVPTPFRIPHRVLALIGVITFILACCLAGCTSNAVDSDSSATDGNATGEKTLRVAMELAYPPFETKDDAGNPEGLAVDFIRDFGAAYGYDVQIENTAWDGLIPSLQSDKADLVISSMTITDERMENMFFAKPYIANQQIIIVPAASGITSVAQLEGKVIGLQKGSSSLEALTANPISEKVKEIVEYPDNVAAYMDLQAGRIDVFVVDSVVGRYIISQDQK